MVARGRLRWARAHLAAACRSGCAARPARKGKAGRKNGGSKDEEPLPFHRSRLFNSRESSPGAPGPASAHVIPGPPLPPPLAREAASSARLSPGAATLCRRLAGELGVGVQTLLEAAPRLRPVRGAHIIWTVSAYRDQFK